MGNHQSTGDITPFLKIHDGVWADVFKAYDASLDRYVLLKMLNKNAAFDAALAEQFEREARLMAKVQHPNVVSILSFGNKDGQIYFTAEFIEGTSLRGLLDLQGKLPPLIALHILQEMTLGLQAAHHENIFHRDLKPANVLISTSGHVKLTDFGMASLKPGQEPQKQSTTVMGTLAYLAPEHVLGAPPSSASDLFSLGATFYEMLAGRPAFRGNIPSDLFDNLLHYNPIPLLKGDPAIPDLLCDLCSKLLEKEPDNRYNTASQVLYDIDKIKQRYPAFPGATHLQAYLEAPDTYTPADTRLLVDDVKPAPPSPPRRTVRAAWLGFPIVALGLFLLFVRYAGLPFNAGLPYTDTQPFLIADTISARSVPAPSIAPAREPKTPPEDVTSVTTQPKTYSIEPPEQTPILTDSSTGSKQSQENLLPRVLGDAPDDALPGALHILCTPWCEVTIDDQILGSAPPALFTALAPGSHQLQISNPHYPVYTTRLHVAPGSTDTLRFSFKDLVGTITFEVYPWAEIVIDSLSYGIVPPTQTILLLPGEHTLTLKNGELGEWRTQIIVAAGEKRRQPYNLVELLKN